MSGSQPGPTLGLRRATPPPHYVDSSDSENEQWHDAADVSLNADIEAPASSSRPPPPIDPVEQERSLNVGAFDMHLLKFIVDA